MSDDLKPCPACGHYATVYNIDVPGMVYVSCEDRDCSVCGPFGEDEEKAIEAWNALPRHLRWTKEPPTEPGWYWFRNLSKPKILHLNGVKNRKPHPADEWAGPIQEPVE